MDEFNLSQNRDCGQLWLDDRRLLWQTVRELKPKLAAETGTWRGGGSTFFITSAMKMNGFGLLYSVENDRTAFYDAEWAYGKKWSHLRPHLHLTFGNSLTTYRALLREVKLDFVMLDGGEAVTSAEFDLLAPKVRVGGVVMVHDWYSGKRVPRLEEEAIDGKWELMVIGTGDGNFESGSVGLAKAVKLR